MDRPARRPRRPAEPGSDRHRLSTRVRCVAAHSARRASSLITSRHKPARLARDPAIYALFGVASESELLKPEVLKQVQDASPLNHADATDPELFLDLRRESPRTPRFAKRHPRKGGFITSVWEYRWRRNTNRSAFIANSITPERRLRNPPKSIFLKVRLGPLTPRAFPNVVHPSSRRRATQRGSSC